MQVRLFTEADEAFAAMIAAIQTARRYVYLEVYSFHHDAVGRRFAAALDAAARRGVHVEVIVDGWGSGLSGRGLVRELRAAGADARVYNPFLATFRGHIRRDHRKLLLIDDHMAWLGGLNIGAEFLGDHGWSDLAVQLAGPVCASLGRRIRREPRGPGDPGVRVFLSSETGSRSLRRAYLKAIGAAQERIVLAQSYFLPDRRLLRSIRAAARRGVSVTLLVPGRSDVPLIRAAIHLYYRGLLRAGVRIYEWNRSVLHAKVAAIDGRVALIGSFNFDPLSVVNLEVLAEVHGHGLAGDVERWVNEKILFSRRVELAASGFWDRVRDEVGRRFLSLLWAARRAVHRSIAEPVTRRPR
ncbi:MAG TPA: phospholipase D-like domain-containing protein [Myxococcales bacterium]|nr:phospholipase D-like domain-containing protein [Myxococcales bacterium]